MIATRSLKRSTVLLLLLGMAPAVGCSVEKGGLVGLAGMGGSAGRLPGGAGGGVGQGAGGAAITAGATGLVDARPADLAAAGGMLGTGGVAAPDAIAATGGGTSPQGTGGVMAGDALATGGWPGTGGLGGLGGAAGAGGATTADGPQDAMVVPSSDVPPEAGPELGPPDLPERDLADAAADAHNAFDGTPAKVPIWADEFDAVANTPVDSSKWSRVVWPAGQVNAEEQQYTNSVANVHHDGDGHLVIRALYSPKSANPYTSGRIDTRGKVAIGPGHRVEVRAKLPAGRGSFPGIIMMGSSGEWPDCGQLSLMEQYGQTKDYFYSTVRAGNAPGSGETEKTKYSFPSATTASQDFHVYSLDWYADRVVFQVDGDEILRSNYAATSPLNSITEYIILDVALGGDMGGTIDNDAFPMDMVLDYVRVYEL